MVFPGLPAQETPKAEGKGRTVYLRFGNIKFKAQLLKLLDQKEAYLW